MPDLEKGTQFEIRDRDYTYSALKQLDPFIERCGVRDIQRQGFCVDTTEFFEDSRSPREDRIVFVGSSYIGHLYDKSQNAANALLEIKEAFEAGVSLDEKFLRPIAEKYKISYEYVFWNLLHFVVRDISVEWLCEASPLPVEIYGSGWEKTPRFGNFTRVILRMVWTWRRFIGRLPMRSSHIRLRLILSVWPRYVQAAPYRLFTTALTPLTNLIGDTS